MCVYGMGWAGSKRGHRTDPPCTTHLHACTQVRVVTPSKSWGASLAQKAPPCSTPTPTPDGGAGYTLYGPNQLLVEGVLAGYTGLGGRRALVEGGGSPEASVCQALCSGAGFLPPFYFSVDTSGVGACYCSQEK